MFQSFKVLGILESYLISLLVYSLNSSITDSVTVRWMVNVNMEAATSFI